MEIVSFHSLLKRTIFKYNNIYKRKQIEETIIINIDLT